MTDPSLFQSLADQATQQVREGEAAQLNDHTSTYATAQGSAAGLKEDAINSAAREAQDEAGANSDVTLDHA